jgi:hypothetical protein
LSSGRAWANELLRIAWFLQTGDSKREKLPAQGINDRIGRILSEKCWQGGGTGSGTFFGISVLSSGAEKGA